MYTPETATDCCMFFNEMCTRLSEGCCDKRWRRRSFCNIALVETRNYFSLNRLSSFVETDYVFDSNDRRRCRCKLLSHCTICRQTPDDGSILER